jgi:MFS family permease
VQFDAASRTKALGAYAAVLSSGFVAGQVIGGILVTANLFGSTWRPVFLVNVPIGVAVLALVPKLIPRDDRRGARRLDLPGLVSSALAVCLVVLPLGLGHQENWPGWVTACIVAGCVLAVGFVFIERMVAARGGDPLLALSVLRSPGLLSGLGTVSLIMAGYGGFLFTFGVHLQAGLGYSPLRAGLSFAPCALAFGLCGFYWRKLPSAWHYALPPTGCLVAAAGQAGVALEVRGGGTVDLATQVCLVVFGAFFALAFSPVVAHALVRVPRHQAADASGLLTTAIQLSQAVGVAGFGSVFLALDSRAAAHVRLAVASGHALETAMLGMALTIAVAALASFPMARAVRTARRSP